MVGPVGWCGVIGGGGRPGGGLVGGASRARGWAAFGSLAGNKALVRVLGGYAL